MVFAYCLGMENESINLRDFSGRKAPPSTTKPATKPAAKKADPDEELHKYAAPGEHIEIPAWKRSGLVMKVAPASYGPEGGRRYLVSHNPSDEKGSWYQLEPHHFANNDNPDHHTEVAKYLNDELSKEQMRGGEIKDKNTDEAITNKKRIGQLRDAMRENRAQDTGRRDTEKVHNRSTAETPKK